MKRSTVGGLDPHLFVQDARAASEFYARAFGASEIFTNVLPDGQVLFAELALGPARLLLSEPFPEIGAVPPTMDALVPMLLHLEVDDPDGVVRRAVVLGATVEQAVEERFWGERYGVVRDPFGFRWAISTAREAVSLDELSDRTPRGLAGDDEAPAGSAEPP